MQTGGTLRSTPRHRTTIMWLPREPQPGQRLDASWGAGVIRYLRSNTLLSGVNYTTDRTANGTTLRPRSTRAKAAAAAEAKAPLSVVAGQRWEGAGGLRDRDAV